MKNLNNVFDLVLDQRVIIFNLNHDNLPGDPFQLKQRYAIYLTPNNQFEFDRFLANFIMDHSIMLSENNVYIRIANFPASMRFEIVEEPDPLPGLELLIGNIGWRSLRKQKLKLTKKIWKNPLSRLWGIVHFMDHIQDIAVEYGIATKLEVFGKKFVKNNDESHE